MVLIALAIICEALAALVPLYPPAHPNQNSLVAAGLLFYFISLLVA
jgi:hypothetical protein